MSLASNSAPPVPQSVKNVVDQDTEIDYGKAESTGRLMQRARQILAYGGLDGVMQRPLLHEHGLYPQFAVRANGYQLTDATGQTYVDWINGWGSILLGHCHDDVQTAISGQAGLATSVALMHPLEIEVAESIVEMVPCADMVAFGKNGSDSLTAAIRIARAATGRALILQNGFHGFHDWYTCLHPNVQGILPVLRDYVEPFPYNDLEALKELLNKSQGQVAAVVMEPVNMYLPDEGYLQGVKDLIHEHGGLLVWDEVVTAFRLGRGGAQEYFGVQPDLAVLGKAMGNGMPLSAVVGKRELMKHLPRTAYGMTYRGETISLAAANACLNFLKSHDVSSQLEETGTKVRRGFHDLCRRYEIDAQLLGPAARMTFAFNQQGNVSWERMRSMFVLECLKRGVLTNGNLLVSYAHDQAAVDQSLRVFEPALKKLREAIDAGGSAVPTSAGFSHDASNIQVQGCVDAVVRDAGETTLSGWMLVDGGVVDQLQILLEDGRRIDAEINLRPDLAKAFPSVDRAASAGFRLRIPQTPTSDQKRRFTIIASNSLIERFHCLVVDEPNENRPLNEAGPRWFRDGILFI